MVSTIVNTVPRTLTLKPGDSKPPIIRLEVLTAQPVEVSIADARMETSETQARLISRQQATHQGSNGLYRTTFILDLPGISTKLPAEDQLVVRFTPDSVPSANIPVRYDR